MVTWHWIDMGVSIGWEPDSSLRRGRVWSWKGGFHRWSVADVVAVVGRGAKTDLHGGDVVGRLS